MKYKSILYLDNSETVYTSAIREELHKHADVVDCYFYDEILLKPIFSSYFQTKKYNQELNEQNIIIFLNRIKSRSYDFVLVKEPQYLPYVFFEEIRNCFRNVPIINYNWSSIKKFNILDYRKYFDSVYTFDYLDAKEYGMKYLPLFYIKEYGNLYKTHNNKHYKLSFIGSGYSDGRASFLEKLIRKEKEVLNQMFFYVYTPGKITSLKFKLKHGELSKYCYWKPMHLNGVLNVFKQSKAVIDHPMTIQAGLTIRTFEALAAGVHLYTTNKNIVMEPFYSNDKITIINEDLGNFKLGNYNDYKIDSSFQESFREYRVDNWVKKLLVVE